MDKIYTIFSYIIDYEKNIDFIPLYVWDDPGILSIDKSSHMFSGLYKGIYKHVSCGYPLIF